jgi:hypothetical protein
MPGIFPPFQSLMTRQVCASQDSVHPAANNDGPPWRDNNSRTDNRTSDDHGAAACGDAACAMDAARADDGA